MSRKAVINGTNATSGTVENIILAGDDFTLPGKTLVASETAAIGDTWDGSTFTPPGSPANPVPESVTPLQARRALRAAGLLSTVNAAVAAADADTQDAWEYATEIRRDNAMIAAMATELTLTSEQIDDLFRTAATL